MFRWGCHVGCAPYSPWPHVSNGVPAGSSTTSKVACRRAARMVAAPAQRVSVRRGSVACAAAKPKKVVLAYSGGLDTSIILKWLQDEYGCEVVTFTADLGQVCASRGGGAAAACDGNACNAMSYPPHHHVGRVRSWSLHGPRRRRWASNRSSLMTCVRSLCGTTCSPCSGAQVLAEGGRALE